MNISTMSIKEIEAEMYRLENLPKERTKKGTANRVVYDHLCKALTKRINLIKDIK